MKRQVTVSHRLFIFLVICSALSAVLLVDLLQQVASAKESVGADEYRSLKTFTDVLALVQKNYVEPVEVKKLVEGAIKGMVSALDPHSSYLTPDFYKDLQVETKGEFGGLGIEIAVRDNLLTVIAPLEDSPAARAGIQAGDQIIKIGDDFTKNLALVDAVKMMRGPKGSQIKLSIHRAGTDPLIVVNVVRDIIKVKSVRSRLLEDGYGYVRLAQFQADSAVEFSNAIKGLKDKNAKKELQGLIVDLRNNPGGLLTEAIRVGDLFLDDGIIVYTDGRLEEQKLKYFAHKDGNEPIYPLIVLINGGSASASEIVAGALQDAGRALIVGTQSFGKGSVQTILPLEQGDALRLTTSLYFTKSGRSIQAQGVTPDIVVQPRKKPAEVATEETMQLPKERDLPGALKNPKERPQSKGPDGDEPGEVEMELPIGSRSAIEADLRTLLAEDLQLAEAFRLLKTWRVFQGRPIIQADQRPAAPTA